MTRLPLMAALVVGLGLFACSLNPEKNPAWTLAGQPGLLFKVQQYYETRGTEENGRCTQPILGGVASSRVLSDDQSRMVIELAYYYRDWLRDGQDCSRLRPLRCTINRACRGFAQRIFTIDKTPDGLKVAGMTGGQRRYQ